MPPHATDTAPHRTVGQRLAVADLGARIDASRGRPIFNLGCPRSGTTLLTVIMQAHPRIAMPPENRFVLPVYFGRAAFGDLGSASERALLADEIVTSNRFDELGLEDVAHQIVGKTETWHAQTHSSVSTRPSASSVPSSAGPEYGELSILALDGAVAPSSLTRSV